MAEVTSSNSTRTPPENIGRRNFISECRDSRIIVQANLSPRMRRIYRRHFDGFSRSAYLIRYYSRIVRENGIEAQLVTEITASINGVNENLEKKIAVANQILANNNIQIKEAQFEAFNVTIIDPLANLFLQTFTVAQNLEKKLSALWLACVLDETNHQAAINDIETELQGIQSKSRTLSLGLRDRVRAQRTSNEQSAETDTDITAVVEDETGEASATESDNNSVSSRRTKKSSVVPTTTDNPEEVSAESAVTEEVVD